MAIASSTLKSIVDLKTSDRLHLEPSTALNKMTSAGDATISPYIYRSSVNSNNSNYRYDCTTDVWSPLLDSVDYDTGTTEILYGKNEGLAGRVISASSNTLTGGTLPGRILNRKIRIYAGKGAGQERTIIKVDEPIVHDSGIVNVASVGSSGFYPYGLGSNSGRDTSKKWKDNQWRDYQFRINYGNGAGNIRPIIYNTSSSFLLTDNTRTTIEPWTNYRPLPSTQFAGTSTSTNPSYYQIESTRITIDKPWDIIPDDTSRYMIKSGGVWRVSQYIVSFTDETLDVYVPKRGFVHYNNNGSNGGVYIYDNGVYVTGSVSSATNVILRFSPNLTSSLDRWINYEVRIISGSGFGQKRRIIANTTASLEVNKRWDVIPNTGSTFGIYVLPAIAHTPGSDRILQFYLPDEYVVYEGPISDYGSANSMAFIISGSRTAHISSATRYTGGITAINPIPTVKGTGYTSGDRLKVSGGTLGSVFVESTGLSGSVENISLYSAGSGYTIGTGKVTTGGTGTGCTIEITNTGSIGRVGGGVSYGLKHGTNFRFTGATDSNWNKTYTIIGITEAGDFEFQINASANAVAANSFTTGSLVDSTKNWTTNEHVGKIIKVMQFNGESSITDYRRISSNTSTRLIFEVPIRWLNTYNANNPYVIMEPYFFGRDDQYKVEGKTNDGYATGGSTTTLIDSTKNWNVNQWSGSRFRIMSGTGRDNEITITSNNSNTLTYSLQTFTPDYTSKYLIYDSFGYGTVSGNVLTDTTKNWVVNQWSGKRVIITGQNTTVTDNVGSGILKTQESTITSNTKNTFTVASMPYPSSHMLYTILGAKVENSGNPSSAHGQFIHDCSDFSEKGRYIISTRGPSSTVSTGMDKYDIVTTKWNYNLYQTAIPGFYIPQTAYNGGDYVYISPSNGVPSWIVGYNVLTNQFESICNYNQTSGDAMHIIEVIKNEDGINFLYIGKNNTTTEFFERFCLLPN